MRELSDEARRLLVAFEDEAGVAVRDCLLEERHDLVVFLVAPAKMAEAIGPNGATVRAFEERIGRDVKVVADDDTAAGLVANALAPAAVTNVTISENDDTVAYVEVAPDDRGVAIGTDGKNIDAARRLAQRHFDVDGIELT